MLCYIVNLENAVERKTHMDKILEKMPYFEKKYVKAVDGRLLSENEKNTLFDKEAFRKRYLREPSSSEIGCSLSHQQCYEMLCNGNENYAMIFEDDIVMKYDVQEIVERLEKVYDTNSPVVILLSGWYWYKNKIKFSSDITLTNVYDGFLAQSYLINKSAAKVMKEDKIGVLSDDWNYFIRKGVKIYGLKPHAVDQKWSVDFQSSINHENALFKGHYISKIRLYSRELIRKLYQFAGHYEPCDYHTICAEKQDGK